MKNLINKSFSIENITNASVLMEAEDEKIVIDPWFCDGKYMGTWHNFPRVSNDYLFKKLKNIKICLITHLHKDHFDIEAIKKFLNTKTQFIYPKTFGWKVIEDNLKKNGFHECLGLECIKDFYNTKNFTIRALPPFNTSELDDTTNNELSIDGGFLIINNKTKNKCVFLADNNLYSDEKIDKNIELLKSPDLIAFAYSGFASDYPFNYDLPFEEKIKISNKLEEIRFSKQVNNLKKINPKCVMPYSSEFVPVGKHAKNWHKVFYNIWTNDKYKVAKKYAEALNVKSIALYPEDIVSFDNNGSMHENYHSKKKDLDTVYSEMIDYANSIEDDEYEKYNKEQTVTVFKLKSLLKNASKNYKNSIKRFNFKIKQNLVVKADNKFIGHIDREGNFFSDESLLNSKHLNILEFSCPNYLLNRLLQSKEHWDDAGLSLRLSWKRVPNLYCGDTLNALNYLNIRA